MVGIGVGIAVGIGDGVSVGVGVGVEIGVGAGLGAGPVHPRSMTTRTRKERLTDKTPNRFTIRLWPPLKVLLATALKMSSSRPTTTQRLHNLSICA